MPVVAPAVAPTTSRTQYDKNGLVKEGLKYGLTHNIHGVDYDNDVTNHSSRVKGVWVIRYGCSHH